MSFIILFVSMDYIGILRTSRTMLVGNIAAIVFVASALFFILKIRRRYKVIVLGGLFFFLTLGLIKIADRSAIDSLSGMDHLIKLYRVYKDIIIETAPTFKMQEVKKLVLYNPEVVVNKKVPVPNEKNARLPDTHQEADQPSQGQNKAKIEKNLLRLQMLWDKIGALDSITKEPYQAAEKAANKMSTNYRRGRDISEQYNNMLFRIFIWEDMIDEFWRVRPIFGFDFGKPLRSKSLEIAGFARGEWSRDGWIAPHNSYLHIIYRAGIIGIAYIIFTIILLFSMINKSIRLKSITGVLLCGILINWLVAANFLVILELPYNAIPFWSLFGLSFAYLFKNKSL